MNEKKKFILFTSIFLLSCIIFANSQQTKLVGNYIKLVVFNNDGRFLLYGRNSISDEWTPLLFEDSPSTTFFRFYSNQLQIPFGEEGLGKYSDIEIVNNKIYYYWNDNRMKFEIEYELLPSGNSNYANTLLIDCKIINLKNRDYNLDYIFCLDTYLGETSKNHFVLPNDKIISSEYEVEDPSTVGNILSYSIEKNIGINILFTDKYQITPNRIYFTNWKRIENNIGLYKVVDKRVFDLKPYSINDSAVCLEYSNKNITAGSSLEYRFIISLKSNIIKPSKKEDIKGIIDKEDKLDFEKDKKINDLNNFDLSELLELLDKINEKLTAKKPLIEKEVELYRNILEEIKSRRSK